MKEKEWISLWKQEERAAHIHGWDFSHIEGRYTGEAGLPWDYRRIVLDYLKPEMELLDIDTGGGEFLLSLSHPYGKTSATEAYPPNIQLCRERLLPLGISFRPGDGQAALPFGDAAFDIVINRHGNFNPQEIHRVLKDGGVFITEQVGAENDRELVALLLGETPLPFPEQYLEKVRRRFRAAGFGVLDARECFRPIRFYDLGALVWFARIIEWEFPGFSVDKCRDRLLRAQGILEKEGCVEGRIHRFLLAVRKSRPALTSPTDPGAGE
jgi:SAM-dependent methyltransferase